jgi:hypothetical protein
VLTILFQRAMPRTQPLTAAHHRLQERLAWQLLVMPSHRILLHASILLGARLSRVFHELVGHVEVRSVVGN